ncbi:perlwapin-like isoform X2 [Carassius auratus]|uniref:Perlwapin-like isoform X2 n=1 Tax=Carassius auratus TaxID=7957 RepID=A0A6P6NBT6_CARAU|nr:perlwapin-like isoform X2 [Carassius auratus]
MNARVCCSLTAVLLCLSVCLSTTDAKGRVTKKPGVCPRNNVIGICVVRDNYCFNDGDCPNDQKCCSYGCGRQCRSPYKAKPGVCPSKTLGVGLCVTSCSLDSNCPNDQKCCSNGCGRQCMAPYKEKPGVCPKTTPIIKGVCAELCSHDGDCPNDEKCCSNGSGHQCTALPKEKPGVCPMTLAGVRGPCEELCVSDFDCPRNEKCCSSICGGRICTPTS